MARQRGWESWACGHRLDASASQPSGGAWWTGSRRGSNGTRSAAGAAFQQRRASKNPEEDGGVRLSRNSNRRWPSKRCGAAQERPAASFVDRSREPFSAHRAGLGVRLHRRLGGKRRSSDRGCAGDAEATDNGSWYRWWRKWNDSVERGPRSDRRLGFFSASSAACDDGERN